VSTKPLRVLLAEDHFLPRFAVRSLLEREPDLQVVAEAETGWQAVALWKEHRPDVVLMDLRLPELDGHAAIAAIRRDDPAARILVLSNYEREEDVKRAMAAGAAGYLRKDVDGARLLEALRRVAGGGRYLPETASQLLAETETRLSAREREILTLVCQARTNAEVGRALGISEGTVRIHMTNIMVKLGVKRRTEAITVALKKGLVRAE
jgi:two-component system NarL family response regulator